MQQSFGGKRLVHLGVAVCVFAGLSGACGGADETPEGRRAQPPTSGQPAEGAQPVGSAGEASTKDPAPAGASGRGPVAHPTIVPPAASSEGGGAKGLAGAAENPYTRTLKIEAELEESCVRPGSSQTITIRSLPGAGVGYDTQYADYLTGLMEGHYGGNDAAFIGKDGTWTSTWMIAPNAPAGLTTVLVLGSHETGGIGETKAFFNVADLVGKCS